MNKRNTRILDKFNEILYSTRRQVFDVFGVLNNISLVVAIGALLYAVGFDLESDEVSKVFLWLQVLIFVFILEYFVHLLYAYQRKQYIRSKPLDSTLVFLTLFFFLLKHLLGFDVFYNLFLVSPFTDYHSFYEFFITAYLLILSFIGMARLSTVISNVKIQPATTFILSFVILILGGALLLMMPSMTTIPGSMRFIDALFTSASAACVTGLAAQDTASFFTVKGQVVILIVIQLGGIGIVTFATFFATYLSAGVSMKQQAILQDMLSTESLADTRRTLRKIIQLTFLIEAIGAFAIFFSWGADVQFHTPIPQRSVFVSDLKKKQSEKVPTNKIDTLVANPQDTTQITNSNNTETALDIAPTIDENEASSNLDTAKNLEVIHFEEEEAQEQTVIINKELNNSLSNKIWYSVFHSVSAFCNAGFSLFSSGLYETGVDKSYIIHLIIAFIIIFGSLGYTTIDELFSIYKMRERMRTPWKQWSIGTTIAVNMTIVLVLLGSFGFYFLEQENTLSGKNFFEQIVTSFFQSVTTRTAGFNTVEISVSALAAPTYLMFIFLMFIGAASGSTGGGIKTSTFMLVSYSTLASITGRRNVEIAKRTIPTETISKAFSIIAFALAYNALCIFLLSIVQGADLRDLIFEQISAFATVGLSTGITGSLNDYAKSIIIASMYVGRVGTLTLAFALSRKVISTSYQYPSANVMVG